MESSENVVLTAFWTDEGVIRCFRPGSFVYSALFTSTGVTVFFIYGECVSWWNFVTSKRFIVTTYLELLHLTFNRVIYMNHYVQLKMVNIIFSLRPERVM